MRKWGRQKEMEREEKDGKEKERRKRQMKNEKKKWGGRSMSTKRPPLSLAPRTRWDTACVVRTHAI